MKPLIALFTVPFFLFSFTIMINQTVNYKISTDFSVKVKGTSNVHDWESNVEKLSGTAVISIGEDGMIQIDECKVSIPVKSIKSTKGSIMDKKTWKALKEEDHSNIDYRLSSFDVVNKTSAGFAAKTKGLLSIAGVTKTIDMSVTGKELSSGNIEITGSKALKMTTFGIDPPTAMLGAMTTGDDITIEFRIVLDRN